MTQEEKEILLKDLCARLPYGIICRYEAVVPFLGDVLNYGPLQEIRRKGEYFIVNGADCLYEDVRPYLRPTSSMTEEEEKIYNSFINCIATNECGSWELVDWLNFNQFDYRGLIPKGIALEAPKDMYKTK